MGEHLRENGITRKPLNAAITVIIDLGRSHPRELKPWSVGLLGNGLSQSVTPQMTYSLQRGKATSQSTARSPSEDLAPGHAEEDAVRSLTSLPKCSA